MTGLPPLSIVVPAYNEAGRIEAGLEATAAYLAEHVPAAELIVVDDGSTDDTAALAQAAPGARVLRHTPNRGKGYAVRRGMLAARGAARIFMDADLSTPLGEIPRALAALAAGADVVFGTRSRPESRVVRAQPRHRELMGKSFNLALRGLRLADMPDTQCGFKAFSAAAAVAIFERATLDGFAFDVEVLLLARRLGQRVQELPVEWHDSRPSKVRLVGGSAQMLADVLRLRWRYRR